MLRSRAGDVLHSQADVSALPGRLGDEPTHLVGPGLAETVRWFAQRAVK